MSIWPYDLTAEFYDEDMGRNVNGRDLDWYVSESRRAVGACGGPVVELGCGTGRVTLALAGAGVRVIAADRSIPMLRMMVRKAAAAGLAGTLLPVALDMGRPAITGRFAAILCPYSAFAYLIDDDDRRRMLDWARQVLAPGGVLLLDMFIPDPTLSRVHGPIQAGRSPIPVPARIPDKPEFNDYRRDLPPGPWAPAVTLARSKRLIFEIRPGVNRIERRYQFLDSAGLRIREVRTQSDQRPYTPSALRTVLTEAGFTDQRMCGDFDVARPAAAPARMTAVAARLGAE